MADRDIKTVTSFLVIGTFYVRFSRGDEIIRYKGCKSSEELQETYSYMQMPINSFGKYLLGKTMWGRSLLRASLLNLQGTAKDIGEEAQQR